MLQEEFVLMQRQSNASLKKIKIQFEEGEIVFKVHAIIITSDKQGFSESHKWVPDGASESGERLF